MNILTIMINLYLNKNIIKDTITIQLKNKNVLKHIKIKPQNKINKIINNRINF